MEGEKVARSVAAVVIGYIRWTQIVPMLMAWAFLIGFHERDADTGSEPVTWESFQTFVLQVWAGLALVLLVLGSVREAVFGPAPPSRLVRNLAVTGVMGLVAWIAFTVTFLLSTEPHSGHPAMWVVMFALWCGIPVGVSVYSLSVSHVLGRVLNWLDEVELKPAA